MSHTLLTVSFAVGALVSTALLLRYGLRSKWRESSTGHVLLSLFLVTALSYNLSLATLIWPEQLHTVAAESARAAARFAIDGVLIGMYVLLVRAQRRDRDQHPAEHKD